jgi:hypothetical protein
MRKMLTVGLVSIGMVLGAYSAQAGDKHYKGKYYGYSGYHHGYYSDIGDEILIGAGIIGVAILLSNLLSRPQYPPTPVYYAPRRAPNCHQERVYRYLPDGHIQWGSRTHCY